MSKKEAMVAPRPLQHAVLSEDKLAEILQHLGNDRAYTIIRLHNNSCRVHFDGDLVLSTVKFVNDKPVIIKDLE